jgi:predicted nucleic acid-binding Zn ribbon protein
MGSISQVDAEEIMFCDGCGATVEPGQAFCSRCGKQILGPITAVQPRRRVQGQIQLLAIFWFAISAFNAICGVVLYILANTLLAPGGSAGAPVFLRPLLSVVAIVVLGGAALGFCAGWGLLHFEPWARVLALVLAFLVLFINIPVGTAVGVYTMWVLLPGESEQEYEALVNARAA